MKILTLKSAKVSLLQHPELFGLLILLLLIWFSAPHFFNNPFIGAIDPNIWLLIVLSMICFLLVTGMCWWMLDLFWLRLELPSLNSLLFNFNLLTPWYQLGFYWASFALLLSAAVGCLIAIC
jgi:hypothetical protein